MLLCAKIHSIIPVQLSSCKGTNVSQPSEYEPRNFANASTGCLLKLFRTASQLCKVMMLGSPLGTIKTLLLDVNFQERQQESIIKSKLQDLDREGE